MKKCPKCGRTYDDSWTVCLTCEKGLSNDTSVQETNPELRKGSDRKRSKGVTVFAVLIIAASVLSIMSLPQSWQFSSIFSNILYLVVLPASIVSGIALLRLKKWARVAVIAISVIVAAETIITAPMLLSKITEIAEATTRQGYAENLEEGTRPPVSEEEALAIMIPVVRVVIISMIAMSVLFNCLVILFFTRPKVREQFGVRPHSVR